MTVVPLSFSFGEAGWGGGGRGEGEATDNLAISVDEKFSYGEFDFRGEFS